VGALALVDDGDRTWQLASGVPRLDAPEPLRPDARFRIGSLTKTFVATVALQLVAEGRLGLDDPVSRWLPDVLPNGSAITLRMLLNHTSGLYNYTSSPIFQEWAFTTPTRPLAPDDLVALATAQPATFPPGEGWAYSNTGYVVAGLMIEAAAGRDIENLVRERILDPLDLDDTSFPRRAPNISGYHANGYLPPSLTGEGYWDVTKLSPTLTWAAGGMISTADDVHRFFAALLGGELLTPATLTEMLTTVPVAEGWGYGLGIESLEYTCGTVWGHSGSVQGYFTLAYNDVSGDRSALVTISTRPDQTLIALLHGALDMAICQMLHQAPPAPDDAGSIPARRGVPDPFA
jgi:D-alanyl-D-alanine carboxypeptidase